MRAHTGTTVSRIKVPVRMSVGGVAVVVLCAVYAAC